jgi:hypothetical protein
MRHCVSGTAMGSSVRRWIKAFGLAAAALASASCAKTPLQKVPPPVTTVDNEMALQGQVCSTPPTDAVFPVKILFLVDVSGSMIVTDPAKVRVQAVNGIIQKYQNLPGLEFGVITFSSSIVNVTNGFTSTPTSRRSTRRSSRLTT